MPSRSKAYGTWLLTAAAAVGLVVSIVAYFDASGGIDHTPGVVLVIVSTALLLGAALVLALAPRAPAWLRILLLVLIALDILGTAAAAYFLQAWLLLALMVLAAVGWIASLVRGPDRIDQMQGSPA
jgi:hypothetical protein